jgi:hypothetical protein
MASIRIYIDKTINAVTERLVLPVNPEKFEVERDGANDTETVVGIGAINILRLPGLRSVSIESIYPNKPTTDATAGYLAAVSNEIWEQARFIDWIETLRDALQSVTLTMSGTHSFVMQAAIESFDYYWTAGDDDLHYTLKFKEWKDYSAQQQLQVSAGAADNPATPAPKTSAQTRGNASGTPAVGSTVIVNGRLYRDSYGSGPGATETNATRRITLIAKGRAYPYHVATLDGGARGWVSADSVKVTS